jgi:hypothetical protein
MQGLPGRLRARGAMSDKHFVHIAHNDLPPDPHQFYCCTCNRHHCNVGDARPPEGPWGQCHIKSSGPVIHPRGHNGGIAGGVQRLLTGAARAVCRRQHALVTFCNDVRGKVADAPATGGRWRRQCRASIRPTAYAAVIAGVPEIRTPKVFHTVRQGCSPGACEATPAGVARVGSQAAA